MQSIDKSIQRVRTKDDTEFLPLAEKLQNICCESCTLQLSLGQRGVRANLARSFKAVLSNKIA
jgi:hypothetical protein